MFSFNSNSAQAHIKGNKEYPNIDGFVYFKETREGIIVSAKIKGLPHSSNTCNDRFFGFHIHNGVSCTGNNEDEFADAGMHYNPTNCPHPFHSGDLPPLIENNGYAYMSVLINKFKIKDTFVLNMAKPLLKPFLLQVLQRHLLGVPLLLLDYIK